MRSRLIYIFAVILVQAATLTKIIRCFNPFMGYGLT